MLMVVAPQDRSIRLWNPHRGLLIKTYAGVKVANCRPAIALAMLFASMLTSSKYSVTNNFPLQVMAMTSGMPSSAQTTASA